MMNHETKLKVQAYLDDELSQKEAQELVGWLEQNAEARALYGELNDVTTLLSGGELEVRVPETREFYWSKIERAIRENSVQRETESAVRRMPWWLRLVAPAVGAAVVLVAAISVINFNSDSSSHTYLHEIETPLEDTTAISFHSQAAGMTVVWVETSGY